jgi:hypothetical protein
MPCGVTKQKLVTVSPSQEDQLDNYCYQMGNNLMPTLPMHLIYPTTPIPKTLSTTTEVASQKSRLI